VFGDGGTGTWTTLASNVLTTTYTATGLTNNVIYSFKVQATNVVGASLDSTSVSIRAAAVPDQPASPTSTLSNDQVVIDWTAPPDGGSPITGYVLTIRKSDGDYAEETVNCDGSDSSIIAATQCTVPVSVLLASPYSLSWGNQVYTIVTATNLVGTSVNSAVSSTRATLMSNPDPPRNLGYDTSSSSGSQIALTWDQGANNYGSAVSSYRVSYDAGDPSGSFSVIAETVSATTYTATGLTASTTYRFKVEALNDFGYSTFSDEVSILAAQEPDAPESLTNDASITSETRIGFTWSPAAFDGGTAVIDYRVTYDQGTA